MIIAPKTQRADCTISDTTHENPAQRASKGVGLLAKSESFLVLFLFCLRGAAQESKSETSLSRLLLI